MINTHKSYFITLEGIDGSGKSTLIKKLESYLIQQQKKVIVTAEPTQSSVGRFIREFLSEKADYELNPLAELFLFSADRALHIDEIKNYLSRAYWVLCDRYVDSTLAYQGKDLKNIKTVYTISKVLLDILRPDLTILLDSDPEKSLRRIDGREKDYFEQMDFLKDIRKRYLELSRDESDRFVLIDGNQDPDIVEKEAIRHIDQICLKKKVL
jgi:dTMP kinase